MDKCVKRSTRRKRVERCIQGNQYYSYYIEMGVIWQHQMYGLYFFTCWLPFSPQGDTSPDDAAQWATYYRSQVGHNFWQYWFELILIQGMNSEAVMIETFIRGLLAGRQGKDSSEGRSTPFPCRKFHQKTTNLEQQFLTSCITLTDLVLQLKRIWWPMVLQTLATVVTGE